MNTTKNLTTKNLTISDEVTSYFKTGKADLIALSNRIAKCYFRKAGAEINSHFVRNNFEDVQHEVLVSLVTSYQEEKVAKTRNFDVYIKRCFKACSNYVRAEKNRGITKGYKADLEVQSIDMLTELAYMRIFGEWRSLTDNEVIVSENEKLSASRMQQFEYIQIVVNTAKAMHPYASQNKWFCFGMATAGYTPKCISQMLKMQTSNVCKNISEVQLWLQQAIEEMNRVE